MSTIVSTFGSKYWRSLGALTAGTLALQTRPPDEIITAHKDTLAQARNYGADVAKSEWLIFLDADDSLDSRYIQAMLDAPAGDIRRPSTVGVYEDGSRDAEVVMIPEKPLLQANYIPVSAMIRRDLFMDVGGFHDLPVLEDWQLWIRMWLAGAEIVAVPDAILEVTVRTGSRNRDERQHGQVYAQITREFRGQQPLR